MKKKTNFKLLLSSLSIMLFYFGSMAVKADTNGPSEAIQTVNYTTIDNKTLKYYQFPNETPNPIEQPQFPSVFPVKNIYANYVRNGGITASTTKIYVVMNGNGAFAFLPYDSKGVRKISQVYLNLYSTIPYSNSDFDNGTTDGDKNSLFLFTTTQGSTFDNSKAQIDTQFSGNTKIKNTDLNGFAQYFFTDSAYYLIESSRQDSKPILRKNISDQAQYWIGTQIELTGGNVHNNYYANMFQLQRSKGTVLKPTINKVVEDDLKITGKGTNVGNNIAVSIGGKNIGKTQVNEDGTWTFDLVNAPKLGDVIKVDETSRVVDDTPGSATITVTKRTNLPINIYPTAIATRQVIGYGSQPGATISIGDGFGPNQKTTTVDSNGNWQLPIAPPDHIWDTTYNITITNARGSSTIKFQPFGITQVAPLNFGTVDLASISDYSKQLPLPKWDGISFGSDLTKTSPWEISINKVTDFNANIKLYYRVGIGTGKMTNTEVTTTPMRFMNNNFKDVLNSVINGNTAKLSAKNNLYLDISKTEGLLKPTDYKATYNFALTDAPM